MDSSLMCPNPLCKSNPVSPVLLLVISVTALLYRMLDTVDKFRSIPFMKSGGCVCLHHHTFNKIYTTTKERRKGKQCQNIFFISHYKSVFLELCVGVDAGYITPIPVPGVRLQKNKIEQLKVEGQNSKAAALLSDTGRVTVSGFLPSLAASYKVIKNNFQQQALCLTQSYPACHLLSCSSELSRGGVLRISTEQ